MKARFVRGSETRLRIIRTAADLFHKQGARATSPDEIIEASQTGKGQFYHYFKSKEGLVHEVLQTYLDEIKSGAAPVDYEISSWRDLEKWFRAHVELQKHYEMTRGCPFGTLGNEATVNDELIRQDVSLIFEVIKTSWRHSSSKKRPRESWPSRPTQSAWLTFASRRSKARCSWAK